MIIIKSYRLSKVNFSNFSKLASPNFVYSFSLFLRKWKWSIYFLWKYCWSLVLAILQTKRVLTITKTFQFILPCLKNVRTKSVETGRWPEELTKTDQKINWNRLRSLVNVDRTWQKRSKLFLCPEFLTNLYYVNMYSSYWS